MWLQLMMQFLQQKQNITFEHFLSPRVSDDRKEASRPKKKFLAGDVRRMHDILSKNMYKIRQKVISFRREVVNHFQNIKYHLNSQ